MRLNKQTFMRLNKQTFMRLNKQKKSLAALFFCSIVKYIIFFFLTLHILIPYQRGATILCPQERLD